MQNARIAALHKRAHGFVHSDSVDKLFADVHLLAADHGIIMKKPSARSTLQFKAQQSKDLTEFMLRLSETKSKFDSKQRRLKKMAVQDKDAMTERLLPRLEAHLKKVTKKPIKDTKALTDAIFDTASLLNLTGVDQAASRFVNSMYTASRAYTRHIGEYMLAHVLAQTIDTIKSQIFGRSIAKMVKDETLQEYERLIKAGAELNKHIESAKPKDRQGLTTLLLEVNSFLIRARRGPLFDKRQLVGKDTKSSVHMTALKKQFTDAVDNAIRGRLEHTTTKNLSTAINDRFRTLQFKRNIVATRNKFDTQ